MASPLNPLAQPYYHVPYSINYYNLHTLSPCLFPLPPTPPLVLQNNTFYFHQYLPSPQFPIKFNLPNQVVIKEVEEEEVFVKRDASTVGNLNEIRSIKKKHWRVKGQKYPCSSTSDHGDEFQFKNIEDAVRMNITTVMVKNIPNKLDKKQMVKLIDEHCLEVNKKLQADGDNAAGAAFSEFNFLYLPIDFKTGCNKGFAFVNFNTPTAAYRFYQEFHGKSWAYLGSNKVCEVKYARIQGLRELLGHFNRSFFNCASLEYLPVYFTPNRDGFRMFTNERYIGKHIRKQA